MEIGSRIRELRRKAGYTQAMLAEKIGVTTSAVGFWEVNRRQPDIVAITKIAEIFNVSTDYLINNQNRNVVSILCRDGSQIKLFLNDEQIEAIKEFAEKITDETKCNK